MLIYQSKIQGPDRTTAVPSFCLCPDHLIQFAVGRIQLAQLDAGPFVALGGKVCGPADQGIDDNSLFNPQSGLGGSLQIEIVVLVEKADVVETFVTSCQKIPIGRRRLIELLNQFNLQVARVSQRDANLGAIVRSLVSEIDDWHPMDMIEGTDVQVRRPVAHCGFDVAHDIAQLADWPE